MTNAYRIASKIIPRPLLSRLLSLLAYSGIRIDHYTFIGLVTLASVLIGIVAGFFLGAAFGRSFWIFFPASIILTNLVVYLIINLKVDKKAEIIEDALPDALQLMSSNLRAGMTPDQALLLSARPEFGPLKDEIEFVGKKVTVGENIAMALNEMAGRVRSKRLLRAVELINSGVGSGGSLAPLLEATSNHLREQYLVDKKVRASITMYFIFIFSAASIITPVLLGLSSFLVEILTSVFSQIQIPASSSLPIKASTVSISTGFLNIYIVSFLTANSFLASLILGLVRSGKRRAGIRYFIPMVLLALPSFFIVRKLIRGVLSGLFSF